jgi:6-phosphogluconolactonase (cycloisomerase 2 family)
MTDRSISISPISRRHFIAAAGMTALTAQASPVSSRSASVSEFAYAASHGKLTAYSTSKIPWIHIQTLASEAPVSLVTDRATHTLHVLHAVSEYRGLPCGYIESFRIDKYEGHLKPLSKQPLSLSGIQPSSMALSPDGKALAVAIRGGAAYNLLPILEDGRPGRPQAIRKEIGVNRALSSRPGHIVFNRTGDRLFVLDHGTATFSVLSAQSNLPVLSRIVLPEGSRFLTFAAYVDADLLFSVDAADGSLLSIRHHPDDARLSSQTQVIHGNFLGPLAVHAASKTLSVIASDGLHIFRIQAETAQLSLMQHFHSTQPFYETQHLLCDSRQNVLYLASNNGIFSFSIDPHEGRLSAFTHVAPAAQRIALL